MQHMHIERPKDAEEISSQKRLVKDSYTEAFANTADGLCKIGLICVSLFLIFATCAVIFLMIMGCFMLYEQQDARSQVFNWLGGIIVGFLANKGWVATKK